MWLPSDERRLLAGYFRNIGRPDEPKAYRMRDLVRLLSWRCVRIVEYGDETGTPTDTPTFERVKDAIPEYIRDSARVDHVNGLLASRKLVDVTSHEAEGDVRILALTLEGYDLGRRYSSWWNRLGLWFEHIRHHPVCLVVVFLLGVVSTLVIQWLFSLYGG
jgi:hypothetical protein